MAKALLVAVICTAGCPGIINFLPPGKPDDQAVNIEFDETGRAEVPSDVARALVDNVPGYKIEEAETSPASDPTSEGEAVPPKPRPARKKKAEGEGGEPSGDGDTENDDPEKAEGG